VSARKRLLYVREAVERLGRNSVLPGAREVMDRTLVAIDELREIMAEFLVECPHCNGARGFTIRGPKGELAYAPCPYCDGFGCLSRKAPEELFPSPKSSETRDKGGHK
jgi:hypothetical protein